MRGNLLKGQNNEYAIFDEVGEGGVGKVYRAKAVKTGQDCAVKILHTKRFAATDVQRRRFHLEIEATCWGIKSPYVVEGLDFGLDGENAFLVMEWMPGGTLQDLIASEQAYDQVQAISMIAQLLKGYRDIRAQGYVHRDIKPNNVLLTRDRRLKLSDLGVAKNLSHADNLTITGTQIGSLLYITEHQRRYPDKATARDDFYSLCLVIYELVTRRRIHISNPRLDYLRPSIIPRSLALLIDRGMTNAEDWEDVLQSMCDCIDLEREAVRENHLGSLLVPSPAIEKRKAQVVEKLRALQIGTETSATTREMSSVDLLLDAAATELITAYEQCASEFEDVGVYVSIDPGLRDGDSILFSASFDDAMDDLLKAVDIHDSIFDGKMYGWLVFERVGEDAFIIAGTGGKRLYADESFMPEEKLLTREIRELDEPTRKFLRQVGRGLAIGVALGALNRVEENAEWAREEREHPQEEES